MYYLLFINTLPACLVPKSTSSEHIIVNTTFMKFSCFSYCQFYNKIQLF